QQALAAHRLGLDYVLQRVARFPWSQPPGQRFAEKMMEQAIGVTRLGPSSDDPARRIELERGANHRARILLGYVPHLHLPERCLDPPLPQPGFLGDGARLVLNSHYLFAVAVPQVVDRLFEPLSASLAFGPLAFSRALGTSPVPQRRRPLPGSLRRSELPQLLLGAIPRPAFRRPAERFLDLF